jgi:hypothetical protein
MDMRAMTRELSTYTTLHTHTQAQVTTIPAEHGGSSYSGYIDEP